MLSSSSVACLSARLGDKGLFSSANILQIAHIVRRVVFLFLPRETSEKFRHFVLTTKTTQPRPQVVLVNCPVFWQVCCRIDVIFHISQTSSKFGRQ